MSFHLPRILIYERYRKPIHPKDPVYQALQLAPMDRFHPLAPEDRQVLEDRWDQFLRALLSGPIRLERRWGLVLPVDLADQ